MKKICRLIVSLTNRTCEEAIKRYRLPEEFWEDAWAALGSRRFGTRPKWLRWLQAYRYLTKMKVKDARVLLSEEKIPFVMERECIRLADPELHEQMARAKRNMVNIVGSEPDAWVFKRLWRDWLKIERGRDLFIQGLGSFDITKAGISFEIKQMQSIGYAHIFGPHSRFTYLPKKMREYLIHWKDHFEKSEKLKNRIDELWGANPIMSIPPEQLMEQVKVTRELERKEPFTWTNSFQPIEEGSLVLEPIRSPDEMYKVGNILRNCVGGNYTHWVIKRKMVFGVLKKDGVPIAVANYNTHGIVRAEGYGSMMAEPEHRKIFEKYADRFMDLLKIAKSKTKQGKSR